VLNAHGGEKPLKRFLFSPPAFTALKRGVNEKDFYRALAVLCKLQFNLRLPCKLLIDIFPLLELRLDN